VSGPRRRRTRVGAAALAVAALASSACGVGDRQAQAERIARARALVVRDHHVTATVRYSSKHKPGARSTGAGLAGAAAGVNVPASMAAGVTFDFAPAGDVAGLTVEEAAAPAPPAAGATDEGAAARVDGPDVRFAGSRLVVQRETRRPAERRVWASLDLQKLPDDERTPQQSEFRAADRLEVFAKTINPIYLLDLSLGTLAGSVERVGEVRLDGGPATHYRANLSLEKASSEADLSDDEVETRKLAFRLGGVTNDVLPVDYWLAPDGRLLRARYRFEQRHLPRIHDIVSVDLRLSPAGGAPPASVPAAPTNDLVINVNSYSRYVRQAVARSSGS
jgi:hypothetical protein